MKFVSFDLEIADEIPPYEGREHKDWKQYRPLGITCAAACYQKPDEEYIYKTWSNPGRLTQELAVGLVHDLKSFVDNGYTIVTFNGLGFDFDILAEESGEYEMCAEIALTSHVDIMFQWLCRKGWRIGLDGTCSAMKVGGKKKEVALNDGTVITEMHGAKAPAMWKAGEHEAVLAYLKEDVRATLDLVHAIEREGAIDFKSSTGKWHDVKDGPLLVVDALAIPEPDTSWMSQPTKRDTYFGWMPGRVLRKAAIEVGAQIDHYEDEAEDIPF